MKKAKKAPVERDVKEIEFILGENQSLVVSCSLLGPGLDRVIVKNEDGQTKALAVATSGSHFHFKEGKESAHRCDFWIANLDSGEAIADILQSKFWGQFNWGELIAYQEGKRFSRKIKRRIKQLVEEFESHAAKELNQIPKPSK